MFLFIKTEAIFPKVMSVFTRVMFNLLRLQLKTLTNPYVMSGDFNLLPDTQSIKKLEDFGLRNLIKEHNITSTRTSLYPKAEKFADYTLTSKKIIIEDFKVLTDEVSDHSPLYL